MEPEVENCALPVGPLDSPKAKYGRLDDPRMTAEEMDKRRRENTAYEYLCHLAEAKNWIEACIEEELPTTTEIEESLRNGVFLAKLALFIEAEGEGEGGEGESRGGGGRRKVYDHDLSRYKTRGLHFRHTDNINLWLAALATVGLPKIFYPETTDIYDRKNMPKAVYCLHALSLFLFRLGRAPQIQDLYGKAKFTEEEISAMRLELEKYGIQMPAFNKIGGILASEMSTDEAALHAAVIAINEAVERRHAEDTLAALRNPAAHLADVRAAERGRYLQRLWLAKRRKSETARQKSGDSAYVSDVYDELLTQAEIQGNLNVVNVDAALADLSSALDARDVAALLAALRQAPLGVRFVRDECGPGYVERFQQSRAGLVAPENGRDDGGAAALTRDDVQPIVNAANDDFDRQFRRRRAIAAVNEALRGMDVGRLMTALQNPDAELPESFSFAGALYMEEFRLIEHEKRYELSWREIADAMTVVSAVAEISSAVETGDAGGTLRKLLRPEAHIEGVHPERSFKYQQSLQQVLVDKRTMAVQCQLMTHHEVQSAVYSANLRAQQETDRMLAVREINHSLDVGDCERTLRALRSEAAGVERLESGNRNAYQTLLARRKCDKALASGDPQEMLWLEEISEGVASCNRQTAVALRAALAVAAVNAAVATGSSSSLCGALSDPAASVGRVLPAYGAGYMARLREAKLAKSSAGSSGGGSGWMKSQTEEGYDFYFNVADRQHCWQADQRIVPDRSLLTRDDVLSAVEQVNDEYDRQVLYHANEGFVIKLQALARGMLTRQNWRERRQFLKQHEAEVVQLQSWYRMQRGRRKYKDRLDFLSQQEQAVRKIQGQTRMFLDRKKYQERLQYFKDHEDSIVKIQSFVKSNWAKQDYDALMHGDNPSISVIRKFVHLLDQTDVDYCEEIELEKLRKQAVSDIRSNQQLESDLNQMDIKIGLLVRNRITIQDVVSQHKSLKKYREGSVGSNPQGLKALSKSSRNRLEAYQHLFYLLQTQPHYLARLIFEMPQSRTTEFMKSVILTLYNYASNQREEYLLTKLFQTALQEEVRSKVSTMSDIAIGNPMVVKMIVAHNRSARGGQALRQLLQPLVLAILRDDALAINTNPVEVYKQWINRLESSSGESSRLPYDVTPEQALQHDDVRSQLDGSIQTLRTVSSVFLDSILSNVDKIPYSMRYMAKTLRDALREKFPNSNERDILKIIGNLIYYRYINSAIVAPDAFDVIDVRASKGLTIVQRRNLASIAKILQFAASNKGFGGDSAHLGPLNAYIARSHGRFQDFLRRVCEVEEPEARYNVDQYTDVVRIIKPIIYIGVAELVETHKLLLDHQRRIAPDAADQLHELLEDVGEAAEPEALLGETCPENADAESFRSNLGKTEISLTLSSKFEVPEEAASDLKSLMIATKRMVVDVIQCQKRGDNLAQVLRLPVAEDEDRSHVALVARRDVVDRRAAISRKAKLARTQSDDVGPRIPLRLMKERIIRNLEVLEKAKLVSSEDNFQSLINSIVRDIRNQRRYRQRRKQEMVRLRDTLKSLMSKRSFHQEQIDYYNEYVRTCLNNLSTKNNRASKGASKRASLFGSAEKAKGSIRYSGSRLHEKGVVLEIDGLSSNQFKNVMFEISAAESTGVFNVNAKVLGVSMEQVQVVFQDLLQLQYEGVAVMQMFDKAKINVNLLIFLLNKKFYGKKA